MAALMVPLVDDREVRKVVGLVERVVPLVEVEVRREFRRIHETQVYV